MKVNIGGQSSITFRKVLICMMPIVVWALSVVVGSLYGRLIQNRFLPCWFNLITGYKCAGCGGTRSFFALMHGDILSSLRYNAFVPFIVTFIIVVYVRVFIKYVLEKDIKVFPKGDNWVFVPLVTFLVYFIVRNFV